MRATFYEALEVPSTAETPTIRAALRTILRRFWSVPRDPSGDTEEAVRFVALGAAILTDNARREAYEVEARRGATVNPWRVGNDGVPLGSGDGQALGVAGSHGGESAQLSIGSPDPKLIPTIKALTEPLPEHTLWESGVGYAFSAVVLAVAALFVYFTSALWLGTISAMLVMLGVLVAGAVAASQTKIVTTELSGFTLSRLAVTKWRRETSVFIGNPAPQQDTAWIFRLRVMELTRSTSGYSSAPHLQLRALARLTDYGLIAIAVLVVLQIVSWVAPQLNALIELIRSPLLLPVIVVLIAIPLETVAIARFRSTPGKYLLGVVVASAVTQPDDQPSPDLTSLSAARAFTFARDGVSFGVWPVALVRWRANMRALRVGEGSWEAAGDSVTLLRAAPLFMRAAAISLVIACTLALPALWSRDAKSSFAYFIAMAEKAKAAAVSSKVASPSTTPSAANEAPPPVAAPTAAETASIAAPSIATPAPVLAAPQ
jgi:RDD family